jgi:hypothetical protein
MDERYYCVNDLPMTRRTRLPNPKTGRTGMLSGGSFIKIK